MDVRSERNGFVQAVTHAYNRHHHLVIRPDDVWIAILSQFNIYINKHSERLRSRFVKHDSKKKLTILSAGTRHTAHFGDLAVQMTELINKNVFCATTTYLKDWILPDFTTTTPNDIVVCSVMMMATMKSYFEYEMTMCGLPSVTLEGEKSDYVNILSRLSKLEMLFPPEDEEPRAWFTLLRPVIRRFAQSFDNNGRTSSNIDFWNKVSHHYSLGSGTQYLSGWITAFCVWDSEGKWQATPRTEAVRMFDGSKKYHPKLVLDGVQYPSIDSADVPMGFCEVEVRVLDGEGEAECMLVAGHMANVVLGEQKDTLKPLPAWIMGDDEKGRSSLTGKDKEERGIVPYSMVMLKLMETAVSVWCSR
ncbi:hypothetical protein CPB84DRAFT_1816645 [Gymnopilus junonius]|uniref:Uncharacterized protein n=1 Tax=Gymnopilus junonius TaxID=109634 RepID=A0A9P5NGQ6_GYMJU|nr:hypothetical protein CPB84DRAFT_1816645 [Gymnopilus junonius]